MNEMKKNLTEFAAELGFLRVGVASPERFDSLPASAHPCSILPECKSVIVVVSPIPRGGFRGIEEGTLWNYNGRRVEFRKLCDFARYIEQETGYEAVPYEATPETSAPRSKPVAEGRPVHNVIINPDWAAVAAGLGEIGFCGYLLTPEYGPRNALGIILTELELEPDPIFEGTICDREDCRACAEICPMHAINTEKTITVDIAGRPTRLASINYSLCATCPNGAMPDVNFKIGQEEMMPGFTGNQEKLVETSTALTRRDVPNILSAVCMRTCIAHLEEADKLTVKYHNKFRTEEPWTLENWER